jgi:anti-sigma B factor antagonist
VPVPEFQCAVERRDTTITVRPEGEVDLLTAGQISEAANAAMGDGADRLVLDLSGVTFIDSTGLRTVVEVDRAARRRGMELVLRPADDRVQRVFALSGLLDRLPFQA